MELKTVPIKHREIVYLLAVCQMDKGDREGHHIKDIGEHVWENESLKKIYLKVKLESDTREPSKTTVENASSRICNNLIERGHLSLRQGLVYVNYEYLLSFVVEKELKESEMYESLMCYLNLLIDDPLERKKAERLTNQLEKGALLLSSIATNKEAFERRRITLRKLYTEADDVGKIIIAREMTKCIEGLKEELRQQKEKKKKIEQS